ncbi:MAG: hypothetical protein ACK4VM_04885 [Bosea sp. (in: a-proteobacteria)]
MNGQGPAGPVAERNLWAFATARLDDFQPLLPAEQEVVARLLSGNYDRLGDGSRPETAEPSRVVRAAFLRFLMLGGQEGCRPHEKGVRITGAWITGVLDLEACHVFRDIGLIDCHFEQTPILRAAIINRLFLDGSSLPGLEAERLEARGGVYLRGAQVLGEVSLSQSRLGGNLECDGATIRAPRGHAIDARAIELRNLLVRGAVLQGGLHAAGARIAADLDCAGTTIGEAPLVALDGAEIEVGGSVVLRQLRLDGEARLVGSAIAGDLDVSGAAILHDKATALDISRTVIKGAFFLRGGAALTGALAMTGSSIGTIHDEAASWPAPGELLLNRCRYGAFIAAPVDAKSRLDWLSRQDPARWGEDFWPQPYEQLASVFREMGHGEDARSVLIVKERLQRRARRARAQNPLWRAMLTLADGFLAATLVYGRQPLLAFLWLILFWLIGVGIFGLAEGHGAFKPNSAVVLRSAEWTLCGAARTQQRLLGEPPRLSDGRAAPGQTQLACYRQQGEASSYPAFNPWFYSLDTLLPVLDLGQKSFWRPDPTGRSGVVAINYFYFQAIIGWALSLLAVAGFSGLVKSP